MSNETDSVVVGCRYTFSHARLMRDFLATLPLGCVIEVEVADQTHRGTLVAWSELLSSLSVGQDQFHVSHVSRVRAVTVVVSDESNNDRLVAHYAKRLWEEEASPNPDSTEVGLLRRILGRIING